MDLNKAMIIGRLTRDPEIRTTPQGTKVASFGLATNFRWTDQQGQKKEQVEYHNIVLWRKLADIAEQYLKKGSQVYIEGRLQTRSWDGQDGKKNYRTEIVAGNMIMLARAAGQSDSSAASRVEQPEPQADLSAEARGVPEETPSIQIDDSDMPF